MVYQEINPTIWKFEKAEDFIEGVLIQIKSNIGANESMLYIVETLEGMKSIWGSTILDERMSLVHLGDKIKITFKGLAKTTKKGKNPAKIFKVEVDKD